MENLTFLIDVSLHQNLITVLFAFCENYCSSSFFTRITKYYVSDYIQPFAKVTSYCQMLNIQTGLNFLSLKHVHKFARLWDELSFYLFDPWRYCRWKQKLLSWVWLLFSKHLVYFTLCSCIFFQHLLKIPYWAFRLLHPKQWFLVNWNPKP